LSSVTDVKAPLEVIKGMGFFFRLRFPFGGTYLSLLNVENESGSVSNSGTREFTLSSTAPAKAVPLPGPNFPWATSWNGCWIKRQGNS
jgi:hypothetical protein